MDIHPGELVYATKGRDTGKCFIVIAAKDNYLYLCDGKSRKVSNPKKKKIKHVEKTGANDRFVVDRLSEGNKLTNKEVRNSLFKFRSEQTI